jgi:hypothetical protein
VKRLSFIVGMLVLAARGSLAQQFQQVGTGLPGPAVWSEGVEVFDADGDGWLDVLFANGNGFSSPGGALAPTLLINHTNLGGPISFLDETMARLPAGFVAQAKGLTVCDVDGDGDLDVVFANAFQTQPRILINDGTGHFTDETAQRFPTLLLDSFGVGFGDVDGDGDVDLVFADAGPSPFGGPGGKARLFLNDGSGHFADDPAFLAAAVNKVGAQNAQMADLDDDFDLDIIVDGKSTGQQLYWNDGTGHFSLATPSPLPAGSPNTYATDWGDLDNDDDLDGAYISLSGFDEGTAQNDLVPGGTATFTGTTATLTGLNGDDDNDVVFLDANNDGVLDLIVGSLGNNQEKLYLNSGSFGPGSFVYQAAGFSAVSDSTLDLAVGDLDNDGRYDVVTAQGESGAFTNRVYRNTGLPDTVPPHIGRVEPTGPRVPLSVIRNGGFVRRAWIQDATYKRGQTFARARLDVTVVKDASTQSFSVPMRHIGGGIHRAAIQPPPSPTGTVGMDVTFSVHATDPGANASDSAPLTFRICGAEAYGTRLPNSTGRMAHMEAVNDPGIGANNFSVTVRGLPPNRPGALLYGTLKLLPGVPFGNGLRFVGGVLQRFPMVVSNGSGVVTLALDFTQFPLAGLQPGETRYFQFQTRDPLAGGPNASDALEITFCD